MKSLILLVCVLVLSACQDGAVGSGPLTLSPKTQAAFEAYKNENGPIAFFVAIDGKAYGYRKCASSSCSVYDNTIQAQKLCEKHSRGLPCKIYARKRNIVWEGAIHGTASEPASVFADSPSAPREYKSEPAPRDRTEVITGTGFVVSSNGYVLTNNHVAGDCREITSSVGAVLEMVASDPRTDLALLKIRRSIPETATFRSGRGIRPGDDVVVIGFPLRGLLASEANVTTGTVSALAGFGDDRRFFQMTAPVQPGSSGGPVLDKSGHIVGVVISKLDAVKVAAITGDIAQNVNFAIHSRVAEIFLDAHYVDYSSTPSGKNLRAADIAERAKRFTIPIECRQ